MSETNITIENPDFLGQDALHAAAASDASAMPELPGEDPAGIQAAPFSADGASALSGSSFPWPAFPVFPFPAPGLPSNSYYSQVRFLNAAANRLSLDVSIDGRDIVSNSVFASVSSYSQVSDGFHSVTVRQTNGPVLYQQTLAFVSGEKATMVILDTANGVTLAKVSDMGCTNIPSGFGCMRIANMSYSGSSYDIRMFNNQVIFSGVGYKEVTSFKQTAAGRYTFFVTGSRISFSASNELPVIILAAIAGGCPTCTVNQPLLTFNLNVRAGRSYTSYIIGNPWSNLYQVLTLED